MCRNINTEYCTQTSYNHKLQLLLRNSALDFLKQPLVTVGRGLHVSYRDGSMQSLAINA